MLTALPSDVAEVAMPFRSILLLIQGYALAGICRDSRAAILRSCFNARQLWLKGRT